MLVYINSSKSFNFNKADIEIEFTIPFYLKQADTIAQAVKSMGCENMKKRMKISDKLADANYQRFLDYRTDNSNSGKPAIYFYSGHIYQGFQVSELNKEDIEFAQQHLRIFSGLYGILKPLDLIQPYRMEMYYQIYPLDNIVLKDYWEMQVKETALEDIERHERTVINLSSKEYSQIIEPLRSNVNWIDVHFKDLVNGEYKFVILHGKKARGMMASYIMRNKINDIEGIKSFDEGGYYYSEETSDESNLVFLRDAKIKI